MFGCKPQAPADNSSSVSNTVSQSTTSSAVSHTLRLPYDAEDSLNPFTVKTLANSSLIPVLYDSLIRFDQSFQAQPVIASSVTGAGTEYTAVLRDGLVFSDGSKLSAEDVVYSYERAKASARYQAQLSNVASVKAEKNTVIFRLKKADPLFINLLDFAIVKKNTAKDKLPIGSGRYLAKIESNKSKLVYNTKHYRKATPTQAEIPLVSMPDNEAILSGIKTGSLSATFSDLSKGEPSTAGALSAPVDLNNLVYLGFHSGRDFVKEPAFRQAIAAVIDRDALFYKGFGGRGKQATLPIHPLVAASQELSKELELKRDVKTANRLLDEAGYTQKDASGFRLKNKKPITLNILVNADNPFKKLSGGILKEMLAELGIQSNVTEKPFKEYQAAVNAGKYDLYIGEMKLLNNMSLSPLLENSAILGGKRSEGLMNAYNAYLDGTGSYSDFITAFNQELPFVPLLFRSGLLIYNRNIKTDITVSVTDVYYNLEAWK
ncbi:MAG: hypothetical protein IJD11_01910 [Oscillospiraceae bacterium]|nr:hypothetical protein [Oscillospiraceae bacterium]